MSEREASEAIFAFGHRNVRAAHRTTLEVTKDGRLSRRGDCIIAVSADRALSELSEKFKRSLRKPNAKLTIKIETDKIVEMINAHGLPTLILDHPADIVIRKSGYIDRRTLGVRADKAASDLSRELVEKMRNPDQKAKITFTVYF